jgi:adenine phosphoribosyltransferase
MQEQDLKKLIREIPDYPKPGILFYDLTTLFQNREAFQALINQMLARYRNAGVDVVAGIEARGFVLAPVLAYELKAGFVPVRKPGKLPWETAQVRYELEYGSDGLEIHRDAIRPGQRVLIVDDLLATGGTAAATVNLVRELGGEVAGAAFAVELTFLGGRKKLAGVDVFSLIRYDR